MDGAVLYPIDSMEKPSGVGIQDHWMKSVMEPQAYGGKPSKDSDGRSVKREREKSSECYAEVAGGAVVTVLAAAPERALACDICDQTFDNIEYLMLHKKFHTGDKDGVQIEVIDNTVFVQQGGKKRRKYKCDLCDVKVNSQYHLDIHRSKHEGNAAKKFACTVCERTFVAPQFLKSHMMTHSASNTICCEVCGVGFTGQAYLKLHMQLHSEVKKFKCGKCDEWFPTKNCVKLHAKKHSKVKNFKCDYCGKCFVSKITMGKHRATHEARPVDCHVQCPQCDRTMHASLLRTHVARAHVPSQGRDDDVKRPHKCETCGKNFIVKINLELHIRVCHPDLVQEEDDDDSNTDD